MSFTWVRAALIVFAAAVVLLAAVFFVYIGWEGMGPFQGLSMIRINRQYRNRPMGEIIFYGASNFTLWKDLEQDMLPFIVQNHGFGGSTDNDMMKYADQGLYSYQPQIVVFQSGSNDFVIGMTLEEVYANKTKMYTTFREHLPGAVFVVLSMLPLPGRAGHWADSDRVNAFLRDYCDTHERMIFVDATGDLMTPQGGFRPELYVKDGIHLNRDGRDIWGPLIKNALREASGSGPELL
ncbi:MAG: GDSL-type esterase/lipase family protein [Treponema sp.]|jgi:lysophospholipase L1-like esterase|nr:GDSL-type esterase/lipase family protein [Treponema sp.]